MLDTEIETYLSSHNILCINKFSVLFENVNECCLSFVRTPVLLVPFLTDSFPFYLVDDYILECYVSNLLSMTAYLPKHRVQILQLIISEMTKIDVSGQI
jgi:RNA polymerase I specific transcription initiation factor RRN3